MCLILTQRGEIVCKLGIMGSWENTSILFTSKILGPGFHVSTLDSEKADFFFFNRKDRYNSLTRDFER